ncbi:hypothetical protein E8E11_006968 [Didymella keratinophila]|nr:hypothetical protein E8E11_006968 [Didymella keratinophila]
MSDPNDLSAREMEVLALAWQCMESEPKIDNKRLAELTGYTEGSASVTMGKIKRKLKARAAESSGVVKNTPKKAATPRAPKTPKSGKRGAFEAAGEGTPTKKGKKASKPTNDDDDDNDDEFANFSIKKEEVTDVNNGADAFFQEATAYANQV